jgi:hypothetical protein
MFYEENFRGMHFFPQFCNQYVVVCLDFSPVFWLTCTDRNIWRLEIGGDFSSEMFFFGICDAETESNT